MDPDELKQRLLRAIPDAEIELVDLTGSQDHYECHIASSVFEGMPRIRQHRLVYQALEGLVGGAIHALALKTYSPAAWANRRDATG